MFIKQRRISQSSNHPLADRQATLGSVHKNNCVGCARQQCLESRCLLPRPRLSCAQNQPTLSTTTRKSCPLKQNAPFPATSQTHHARRARPGRTTCFHARPELSCALQCCWEWLTYFKVTVPTLSSCHAGCFFRAEPWLVTRNDSSPQLSSQKPGSWSPAPPRLASLGPPDDPSNEINSDYGEPGGQGNTFCRTPPPEKNTRRNLKIC